MKRYFLYPLLIMTALTALLQSLPADTPESHFYTLHGQIKDPESLLAEDELAKLVITADLSGQTTLQVSPDEKGIFRINATGPILRLRLSYPDKNISRVLEGPWLKDGFITWEISGT